MASGPARGTVSEDGSRGRVGQTKRARPRPKDEPEDFSDGFGADLMGSSEDRAR